ncbi:LysM peptidoglycan-binding domain-containing protein [Gordonia sp. NPDC003950]
MSQSRRAGRRGAAVALLTGVALAMLVWLIGVAGSDYQESTAPTPVATQVVHVRAGESLNSVAARVAPEMPRQAVIDQIVELNDMGGSALHVGQALLTPAYR